MPTPARILALAAAAALAFNYPFLFLADGLGSLLGIPSLYLYVFVSWAVVIALTAVLVDRSGAAPDAPPDDAGDA